jgi:hypothetical protein
MYRCGWCGNIVDYKSSELTDRARQYKIELAQKFGDKIIEKPVDGNCCPNGLNK